MIYLKTYDKLFESLSDITDNCKNILLPITDDDISVEIYKYYSQVKVKSIWVNLEIINFGIGMIWSELGKTSNYEKYLSDRFVLFTILSIILMFI